MAIRGREKEFTLEHKKAPEMGFFWPVNGHESNLSSGEEGEMLIRGKGMGEEGIGKGSDKRKEIQLLKLKAIFLPLADAFFFSLLF